MATVAEKQATVGGFIDDLATMLDGITEWSDADTGVTNSGDTTDYTDNGRVYQNSVTGQYLMFYVLDSGDVFSGVRFVVSTDWDTTNHHPAGYSNTHGNDDFSADVEFHRGPSVNDADYSNEEEHSMWGVGVSEGNNTGLDRSHPMTYFMSAQSNYVTAAGWNTTDGSNGVGGWLLYEYVDNKFFNDGNDPFITVSHHGYKDYGSGRHTNLYGWSHGFWESSGDPQSVLQGNGFADGRWGKVNPDANDDTFFFKRPVVYSSRRQNVPVAYVEDAIYNDVDEGAAHGDTITVGTIDYRCFRQGGASQQTNPRTVLLRYE